MNRDLFLAILAMDSYNRGYGAGVTGLPDEGNSWKPNSKSGRYVFITDVVQKRFRLEKKMTTPITIKDLWLAPFFARQ